MGKAEKMKIIGGLDSLDQVAEEMRANESGSEKLNDLETEGSEPTVNNDFENNMKVVRDSPEPPIKITEEKNNLQKFAETLKNVDTGETPESLRIKLLRKQLGYKEGEDHKETPRDIAERVIPGIEARIREREEGVVEERKELKRIARRKDTNSFLKTPETKKEVTIEEKPKPEVKKEEPTIAPKPEAQNINEMPVKDKPVAVDSFQQELGRRKFKTVEDLKEVKAPETTVELVASKLQRGEDLNQTEQTFFKTHGDQIQKIFLMKMNHQESFNNPKDKKEPLDPEIESESELDQELQKEKSEIKKVGTNLGKESIPTLTPVSSPEPRIERKPEVEQPVQEKEKPFVQIEEGKDYKFNGNVEFALGKLGILDVSDPRTIETKKAELIENFKQKIPGFLNLSPEKQLYVIDQISLKVNRDLDLGSRYEIGKRDKAKLIKGKGFLGAVANFGIGFYQGITKNSRQALIRSSMKQELKNGGLESHKGSIEALTNFVETRGLDIKIEKGEKILQFLKREPIDEQHRKLLNNFNMAASNYAELPAVWSAIDAKKSKKAQAEKAMKMYEKAEKELLKYELSKQTPETKNANVINLVDIKKAMEINRVLTHNSEVRTFAGRVIRDYKLNQKGGFMLMGAGVRGLAQYGIALGGGATALASMSGGVLGSAITGGITGAFMKKKEFKTSLEQKRSGMNSKEKIAGVNEVINAKGYSDRMKKLIQQINTSTGEKRKDLLQILKNRVDVAGERSKLKLVDWGKGDKEYLNKLDFFDSIDKANEILINESGISDEVSKIVYQKLYNQYYKDDVKVTEKKEEIIRAAKYGAFFGAAGSVISMEVRDWGFHNGEMTKAAWTEIKNMTHRIYGDVFGPDSHFSNLSQTGIPKVEHFADLNSPDSSVRINPVPDQAPVPDATSIIPTLDHPLMATADSRGVIGMFDNLQQQIHQVYDGKDIPEQLKYLTDKNPEELAKMFGGYRPGQTDGLDSFVLNKGASLTLDHNNLVFHDGVGGTQTISAEHGFDGKFFDSHHNSSIEHQAIPETKAPDIIDSPINSANGSQNIANEHLAEYFKNHIPSSSPDENIPQGNGIIENTNYKPVGVEGVTINSPEMSGRINVSYDTFGRVTKMDLGTTGSIAEVRKFLATPDKFIMDNLKDSGITRSTAVHELSDIKSTCAEYLKMRNFLKTGEFKTGTPEYKYLTEQMTTLGEKIHKNAGNIFKPLEDDRIARPNALFGGTTRVPKVVDPQDHILNGEEAVKNISETQGLVSPPHEEIIRTTNHIISPESKLLTSDTSGAIARYGEANIDGNVVFFKNGYVGFYDESIDQATAGKQSILSAAQNMKLLNNLNIVGQTYSKTGNVYRVLTIYKAAK